MIKHGTVRADGKMFWGYHKHAKNGEEWCTPSAFIRRKSKSKARQWMNRRRRTHWLNKYKQHHGCCYCGYDDFIVRGVDSNEYWPVRGGC